MKKLLLFALALFASLAQATVTEGNTTLHVANGTGMARGTYASLELCKAAADAATPRGRYMCKVNLVTSGAAPVVCPAASTPLVEAIACGTGYTGTQTRTTTYTMGLAPACTQSSSVGDLVGTCTAVTPPDDGPPATGNVTVTSCIGTAVAAAHPGDVLVVKPGTYTAACNAITAPAKGTASQWITVKAETDGTVIIKQPLQIYGKNANWYLRFEGLTWDTASEKGVVGNYVKILRSAFRGGPASDNTVTFGIGTNDVTPGSTNILLEDTQFYGPGGRYNLLVYNSEKIVLRRVVARHEAGGWTDTKGDPEAAISIYNSQDVVVQNTIAIDSSGGRTFESAVYHPSNSDSHPGKNITHVGGIIINSGGNGMCFEDGATAAGMLVRNTAIVKTAGVGVCTSSGNKTVTLSNVLIAKTASHAVASWGQGTIRVVDSILSSIGGEQFKQSSGTITTSGISTTAPASMLVRSGAAGALIQKVQGKSGTGWGETGFDVEQADNLFPLALDTLIRKRMCTDNGTSTGMCASSSLSEYVRTSFP